MITQNKNRGGESILVALLFLAAVGLVLLIPSELLNLKLIYGAF